MKIDDRITVIQSSQKLRLAQTGIPCIPTVIGDGKATICEPVGLSEYPDREQILERIAREVAAELDREKLH